MLTEKGGKSEKTSSYSTKQQLEALVNLGDRTNRREWMRMRNWFCVVLGNATTEQPKKNIDETILLR